MRIAVIFSAATLLSGCGKQREKTTVADGKVAKKADQDEERIGGKDLAKDEVKEEAAGMFEWLGGQSPFQLVQRTSIQADLQLMPEQLGKIKAAQSKQSVERRAKRENANGKKSNRANLKGIAASQVELDQVVQQTLTPDQWKRLEQIGFQYRVHHHGVLGLFARKSVQARLEFSSSQKLLVQSLASLETATVKNLLQSKDPSGVQSKLSRFHKEANDKLLAMLSELQTQKWKEMLGPEFQFRSDEFATKE